MRILLFDRFGVSNRAIRATAMIPVMLAGFAMVVWHVIGQSQPVEDSFRVVGGSMAPTVWGPSRIAYCDKCDLHWHVEPAGRDELVCFHCGDNIWLATDATRHTSGDVVHIQSLNRQSGRTGRGELVAVGWEGRHHIKRVAAIPGDTVAVDADRHLLVNGKRLEDSLFAAAAAKALPRFLVDDDSRRQESRWQCDDPGWSRTADRSWQTTNADPSPWLIYVHRDVYNRQRFGPVQDDHPYNASISRRLHSVDRLLVSGQVAAPAQQASIEVAFWNAEGNVVTEHRLERERFTVSYGDGQPATGIPVSANQPVAIRLLGGPLELSRLRIERLVEYRLRSQDDLRCYPLVLDKDEYYVVGDNVPISEDSRSRGPVKREQIVGSVLLPPRSTGVQIPEPGQR